MKKEKKETIDETLEEATETAEATEEPTEENPIQQLEAQIQSLKDQNLRLMA